ncbi:hypothetical protein [Methanoregula sp.]|uniref:hypothetical protein n=1 Tax=Methanoregula sp. TaxID=2052170 RepID=UPI0025FB7834|nr:hypothetical protein [Methanoregula sp.]
MRITAIMCGRYSLACIDDLCGRFRVIDPAIGFRSHFNIAPGSTNPVIVVVARARRSGHDAVGSCAALGKGHHGNVPPDQCPG